MDACLGSTSLLAAMHPSVNLLLSECPATSPSPLGVRAHVWIEARHFFSRADAQNRCWLWLLRHDGQVRVLILPAHCLGKDELLPDLVQLFDADQDEESLPGATLEVARSLPNAPVVPVPRWAVSWGHPVQRAIREFAALLDPNVLHALGELEAPGPFFGSAENYNQLARLGEPVRTHRLQALAGFPPLVAPLLLDVLHRPDMFGDDEYEDRPSPRRRNNPELLDAIDRGRDLIGALATHYRVDRALVRSPLCRSPWSAGGIPAEGLRLLAALPVLARPRHASEVEPRLQYLRSLPFATHRAEEVKYLASAFARGWNETWMRLEAFGQPLQTPLSNTRDFLAAAVEQTEFPAPLAGMSRESLGLAWVARRGLESLLLASRRWHARPLEELPMPEPSAPRMELARALEEVDLAGGQIEELLTEASLVDEGERMHHCVADYWEDCLTTGTRIFHLEMPSGERGTAEFVLRGGGQDPQFTLEQLLGPCNAQVSATMQHLAHSVLGLLNAPEQRERRVRVAQTAQEALCQINNHPMPRRTVRRLDARSRQELAQILTWCGQQADWKQRCEELFFGFVAGFQYADGASVLGQMRAGDPLLLAREPTNPYDRLAVKVCWHGNKLGYIPRAQNTAIARLLDVGTPLQASIVAVNPVQEPWSQVEMVVEHANAKPMPDKALQ